MRDDIAKCENGRREQGVEDLREMRGRSENLASTIVQLTFSTTLRLLVACANRLCRALSFPRHGPVQFAP